MEGGALLYSTIHQDLLQGYSFARWHHVSMGMARIESEEQLVCKRSFKSSFWIAILRGRISALICQRPQGVANYAAYDKLFEERQHAMDAVLTGKDSGIEVGRDRFRSYCYCEKATKTLLWPPFLIARPQVLGKNCLRLRTILENPQTDEAKAFETLVQLSVITRLLSSNKNSHRLVPRHLFVKDNTTFGATELMYVHKKHMDVASLRSAVEEEFSSNAHNMVRQVVAIPLCKQFSKYTFFLLHRRGLGPFRSWHILVGYKGKTTQDYPETKREVQKSVWILAKCPQSRIPSDQLHGWEILDDAELEEFLGASFYHALGYD